jgi:hypothetical protein
MVELKNTFDVVEVSREARSKEVHLWKAQESHQPRSIL